MTPQQVIANVNDMTIWHNRVWVNHAQQTYFVPIWRNGNTEFMHLAEEFGYALEELSNPEYTGYAFIRHPAKRIAGQIWRAQENQAFTVEHCVANLSADTDPHFATQSSFLEPYNCTYLIDLDNLPSGEHRLLGDAHIDAVIAHMVSRTHRHSTNTRRRELHEQLLEYKAEIETAYAEDYELYYANTPTPHVGIVGAGKIGTALVESLRAVGVSTSVYDVRGATDTVERVRQSTIIWICVDTPTIEGEKDFDYTNLQSALDLFVRKTVIVGCTVAPGTCRQLQTMCDIVYMPFLISQGDVHTGLTDPDCWFIGGEYNQHVSDLVSVLSPTTPAYWGTYEEAELAKAMYNAWIIQKINFANWAGDLGVELDADAHKVMGWLKGCTKLITSSAYMTPGWGDGGPCHPRDNLMMSHVSANLPYDPAWNQHMVRQQQALHMAQRAVRTGLPTIILGRAYKPNVDDDTGSYSVLVAEKIRELGGEVYFEDHLTPGDYCYILAHGSWYGHEPSKKSVQITVW